MQTELIPHIVSIERDEKIAIQLYPTQLVIKIPIMTLKNHPNLFQHISIEQREWLWKLM